MYTRATWTLRWRTSLLLLYFHFYFFLFLINTVHKCDPPRTSISVYTIISIRLLPELPPWLIICEYVCSYYMDWDWNFPGINYEYYIAAIKILQRAYISFHPDPPLPPRPTKSGQKTYSTRVLAAPALPTRHRCSLFAKRKKYLRSENTSVVCAAVLVRASIYIYIYYGFYVGYIHNIISSFTHPRAL